MFYELKKENVIVDLENLVKRAKDFDEDISSYAIFMKEQILKKIGNTLVRINVTDQSAEDAYDELVNSSPSLFGILSSIYRLNDEEERFAWSAGIK